MNKSFNDKDERLLYTIKCKDLDAFEDIYKNTVTISVDLTHHLESAYRYGSLEIAVELIRNGAQFNLKYMVKYTSYILIYLDYIEHLSVLMFEKLIDDEVFYGSRSLVNAMFCGTFYVLKMHLMRL